MLETRQDDDDASLMDREDTLDTRDTRKGIRFDTKNLAIRWRSEGKSVRSEWPAFTVK